MEVKGALLAFLVAALAFTAEWLTARAFTLIFGFDVVASVAAGIVVVHRLFDGMPRTLLGHIFTSFHIIPIVPYFSLFWQ
jgi:uncharacterized membrane protein YjjP (DUF1212 family)